MNCLKAVDYAVKGAVVFCDGYKLFEAAKSAYNGPTPGESKWLVRINLGNRLVILTLNACELGSFTNQNLSYIKEGECVARFIDLPFRLYESLKNGDTKIRVIERGIIAPLSDCIRVAAKANIYQEKAYLDLSPEEQAQPIRPILERDEFLDMDVVVGYRPIDVQECHENIATDESVESIASFIRVAAEIGVMSGAQSLYFKLAQFLQAGGHPLPPPPPPGPGPGGNDGHILLNLPNIPEPLHNDRVFNRYICSISHSPIRHPVGDPTNPRVLYEREMIIEWLLRNPTSPTTRQHLTIHQLIPRPAVQALINARLIEHEDRLWDYLESSTTLSDFLQAPVADEDLQNSADDEFTP